MNPFQKASLHGDWQKVRELLEKGADPRNGSTKNESLFLFPLLFNVVFVFVLEKEKCI